MSLVPLSSDFLGKPREHCKNKIFVNAALIKAMIAKIPFRDYQKPDNEKIFKEWGGAEFCAHAAFFLYRLYMLKQSVYEPTEQDLQDYLYPYIPKDHEDPVFKIAVDAFTHDNIPKKDGKIVRWRDLLAVANAFGFPTYGMMQADYFAYNPGNGKFIQLDGLFTEWTEKQLDEYVQPVLIDDLSDLYLDASAWIKLNATINGIVFDPTLSPGLNRGYKIINSIAEPFPGEGTCVYNLYFRPKIYRGLYDPNAPERYVQPFVQHCKKMFQTDEDVTQFISWCAHLIQKPGEKVRWAPVLYSYDQGVGKDTLINFIEEIIGHANSATIKASQLSSGFNTFAQSLLIRISELYDGSVRMNRKTFQEEVKTLISGDSNTVMINPKYAKSYPARNVARVVITTNNPSDMMINNKDRRYDVFACKSKVEMGLKSIEQTTSYFNRLHKWYESGGKESLYSYLLAYDLSNFNPMLPRVTKAKADMQLSSLYGYNWVRQVFDYVAARQPRLQDTTFRTDTLITATRYLAANLKEWDGPLEYIAVKNLRTGYAALGYTFMRGNTKDGRWSLQSKLCSIIKKTDTPDFDPRDLSVQFASPDDIGKPNYRLKPHDVKELSPDPAFVPATPDRTQ